MDLYEMAERLEDFAMEEMSKEKSCIDTKELGEVVDMVKDLLQARKYKAEANYYTSITEAMQDSEYGVDYDYRGKLGYPRRNTRMLPDMNMQRNSRQGYTMPMQSNSRYGFSHDEYMQGRKQYSPNSPEDMERRKELLNDYMNDLQEMAKDMVEDMTPEEKQMWKIKISKIMNM